jgi:DNA-directed RNA polymerase specialized sigma24 family protein
MIEYCQTLNSMLKDYAAGRMDRKELEGKVFIYIRTHPHRFFPPQWNDDSCSDFLSWLYPRMSRAIDRYRERGASFDAYILTMIRLSAKEYGLRKKDHRIIEKTWWSTKAVEMVREAEEPEYPEKPEKLVLPEISNPRQILMLILKSYYYLSEDHLSRLAPALNMSKEELFHMVETLRILRLQRDEERRSFTERVHCQFYRCLAFEKRLQAAALHSGHWLRMKRCLEKARKRLSSMRRHLSEIPLEASNKQVAAVMGIAKGTVDSNLYAVRHKNQMENQ